VIYDYVEIVTPQGDIAMYGAGEGHVVHKTDAGVRVLGNDKEHFFPMHRVFQLVAKGGDEE